MWKPDQFQTIDFQGPGTTILTGINNSGEIIGDFSDPQGITVRGYRGRPGSFVPIDNPPPLPNGTVVSSFGATGINNRGNILISGEYQGAYRYYLLDGTSFALLSVAGRPLDNARGISDVPQVVGFYFPSRGAGARGYQYDVMSSTFSDVTVFDNPQTYLAGINNDRRMVGSIRTGVDTTQAFYLSGSDVTSAHLIFDANSSVGNGINNASDPKCIKHVGTYWTADGKLHGFVHLQGDVPPGQVATFDVPNSVGTQAWGINDNGDIVGAFQDKAGITHGFLAPASF